MTSRRVTIGRSLDCGTAGSDTCPIPGLFLIKLYIYTVFLFGKFQICFLKLFFMLLFQIICWLYVYGYLKLQIIAVTSQPKNLYPRLYEGQYNDSMCLLTASLPFSLSPERHLGGSISKGEFYTFSMTWLFFSALSFNGLISKPRLFPYFIIIAMNGKNKYLN